MSSLLIRGGTLVLPDRLLEGNLLIREGKIAQLGRFSFPKRAEVLDAKYHYVSPGFIDIHVNGGGGRAFMECTEDAFKVAIGFHTRHGTTGLLPTAVAAPLEELRAFLGLVKECRDRDPRVIGAHLNGPFVSPKRAGAIRPEYILPPSAETFRSLVRGFEGVIKIVTLAPEIEGASELIAAVRELGAIPSLGHSDATYEETLEAMAQGIRHFTHIFNAMRDLNHHEPGPVGAVLESPDLTVELIADGVHVHPVLIRLLVRIKGSDSICLVTDAIAAAGQPDGRYRLGDTDVIVREGIARTPEGTLAGSTLTMNRALRNLVKFTGLPLHEAVKMASLTPAKLLRLEGRKGSLEPGKDADIAVFDEDFNVHYTILGGKLVHATQ